MADANGKDPEKEPVASLDLTQYEKDFVARVHASHLKCKLSDCSMHVLVHLIIRVEAGRRKTAHDCEHSEVGICERCKWTEIDWIRSLASDWGGK